jgi:hypothetical protein
MYINVCIFIYGICIANAYINNTSLHTADNNNNTHHADIRRAKQNNTNK